MLLPIPNRTPDGLGVTIYKLIQLSEIVNNSSDGTIVIDFTNTHFLHSVFIAGLFALIKEWESQGKQVELITEGSNIENYLSTIRFRDGLNLLKYPDLEEHLNFYNTKRYTPLVVFPTAGNVREHCVSTILDVIHNQTNISGAFRTAVDYFVSELTNNIAEHSECNSGVIVAQSYVTKGFIDICIADNGIGVLRSYEKSQIFNPSNEAEAIEMAVNGRSTKDLPESRGFGISTSRNIITSAMDGRFILWSGKSIFIQSSEVKHILNIDDGALYNGCFLVLRLPLNSKNNFNLYDYIS